MGTPDSNTKVVRPAHYWPIMLIAAVVAESAHAPLIGHSFANGQDNSAVARALDDHLAALPPLGVYDPKAVRPLAFDGKNSSQKKKPKDRGRLPEMPLVLNQLVPSPLDGLSPAAESPTAVNLGDTLTASSFDGGGGAYSSPVNQQPFLAADPFSPSPVTPAAKRVTVRDSPVSTVPEPSFGISLLLLGVGLCNRRQPR